MPRPLIKAREEQKVDASSLLSATHSEVREKSSSQMDKMVLDRLLRKKRSKRYMEAMAKLDAGGHTMNKEEVDSLIADIRAECPEIDLPSLLLGIVAKCYLGEDFEVHSLDMIGRIITHYRAGTPMPDGLEKARSIAFRGGYEFIEVYADCCRAVSSSGEVSVIR